MKLKKDCNNNIVESYTVGDTRINICNDFFVNRTKEEIEVILQNCTRIASKYFWKE